MTVKTHLPIAVDLDGTLHAGDFTVDTWKKTSKLAPISWLFLTFLTLLPSKRGMTKRRFFEIAGSPDFRTIAWNKDLILWLTEQQKKGFSVGLITGSSQLLLKPLCSELEFFDWVMGSNDETNLVAYNKANALKKKFPDGYIYIGNSNADIPVWDKANAIGIVSSDQKLIDRATFLGKPIIWQQEKLV